MYSQRIWWAFIPYFAVSVVHVWTRFMEDPLAAPTKLLLMPFLALAVVVSISGVRGVAWRVAALLLVGLVLSWLGDGAGTFFPWFSDELPMMLVCFGLAHLCYMALFWWGRVETQARLPKLWWGYVPVYVAIVAILAPRAGAFALPIAAYGVVLVGTAVLAMRLGAIVGWGGFWFLVSDAVLAFRIFTPEWMPAWTGGVVMLTYTLGQLLIAYGVTKRMMVTSAGAAHEEKLTELS